MVMNNESKEHCDFSTDDNNVIKSMTENDLQSKILKRVKLSVVQME